jgi:uncharacterized cupin superfamily protein
MEEPPNVFSDDWDDARERPGWRWKRLALAEQLQAEKLGASLYELPPGEKTWPYHYHYGEEEMLIVVSGEPTLRNPQGVHRLKPGDVVLFRRGPAGAHLLHNDSTDRVRLLVISSVADVDVAVFPDSDKFVALSNLRGESTENGFYSVVPRSAAVDYFEGED